MIFKDLKAKAQILKSQVLTVYFVSKDHRLPLPVRLIAIFCVAYALSPIDLVPDFIPILGLMDDFILIPLCMLLIIKLTPDEIIDNARAKAEESDLKPVNYLAALLIIAIWLSIATLVVFAFYN